MTIKNFQLLFALLLSLSSLPSSAEKTPFETRLIKNDSVQINYEFMDEASIHKEHEITDLITKSFGIYQGIFAGSPRDKAGNEYTDFTVRVNRGRYLGGEADPKIIMLTWSDEKAFGYASWQTILLHEVFHLWSAETIRYENSREHWFNEGFAEYYTYRTATQLGLYTPQEAIALAALPVGYYLSSQGLGDISMREAGRDNKTKFDNYFLIYNGGWVAAMVLEHDIRQKTNGAKSLDELMKWLYVNYQRHEKLYTFRDILSGIDEVTGINYNNFFNDYIAGKKSIPVSSYFDLGKASWDLQFNKKQSIQHKYIYQTLGID